MLCAWVPGSSTPVTKIVASGKVKASRVIEAMGRPDLAGCAVRVSGGWSTTAEDWDRFADAWLRVRDRHAARRRDVGGRAHRRAGVARGRLHEKFLHVGPRDDALVELDVERAAAGSRAPQRAQQRGLTAAVGAFNVPDSARKHGQVQRPPQQQAAALTDPAAHVDQRCGVGHAVFRPP